MKWKPKNVTVEELLFETLEVNKVSAVTLFSFSYVPDSTECYAFLITLVKWLFASEQLSSSCSIFFSSWIIPRDVGKAKGRKMAADKNRESQQSNIFASEQRYWFRALEKILIAPIIISNDADGIDWAIAVSTT